MRRGEDFWNVVPVRLFLGGLVAAGVCAGIGRYVPPLGALAVGLYGTLAIGLMLYGLLGSLVETSGAPRTRPGPARSWRRPVPWQTSLQA
jgi:hypothetical protein